MPVRQRHPRAERPIWSTKTKRPGVIVGRNVGAAPCRQLRLIEMVALGDLHDGDDDLPDPGVGDAQDDAVRDARMLAHPGFDVRRIDPGLGVSRGPSGSSIRATIVTSGSAASRATATSRPSGASDDLIVLRLVGEGPPSTAGSAASNGRAELSPLIVSATTPSRSTVCHTRRGSKPGESTKTILPLPLITPSTSAKPSP